MRFSSNKVGENTYSNVIYLFYTFHYWGLPNTSHSICTYILHAHAEANITIITVRN
jgi:hypothetical protein